MFLTNNNSIKRDLEFLLNLQSTRTTPDAQNRGQIFHFCSASSCFSRQTKLWSPLTPTFLTEWWKFHTIGQYNLFPVSGPGLLRIAEIFPANHLQVSSFTRKAPSRYHKLFPISHRSLSPEIHEFTLFSYPHFPEAFIALWFEFRLCAAAPRKAEQTSSLQQLKRGQNYAN